MGKLIGYDAIEFAEANDLPLNKYADPTESAREDLSVDDARDIAKEDPSLIWCETSPQIATISSNIFRDNGVWCHASWCDGEYDCSDVLDADTHEKAEAAVREAYSQHNAEHTVTRVDDI